MQSVFKSELNASGRFGLAGLLLIFLLGQLSACGWRLRGGYEFPAEIETLYVEGTARYSELGNALHSAFAGTNSRLVDGRAGAKAVLHIMTDRADKRILATDSSGRASEYEIAYSLQFRLIDSGGRTLVEAQQVQAKREYRFNPDFVLASDSEVARLQKEMIDFCVQQMLRRIHAGLRHQPAGR